MSEKRIIYHKVPPLELLNEEQIEVVHEFRAMIIRAATGGIVDSDARRRSRVVNKSFCQLLPGKRGKNIAFDPVDILKQTRMEEGLIISALRGGAELKANNYQA